MKTDPATLDPHLDTLRLPFLKEHCRPLATTAAKNSLTHLDYLAQLLEGESALRADRAVARRIQSARFPVIKTLDSFRWDWPKKINRLEIQDLFRLQFVHDHANVIFLGLVGLGKTHLATALGHAACQQGISVLFATAIDASSTRSVPPNSKAPSKPNCAATPPRHCSSLMKSAICPSTSTARISSSKSSAPATNAVPSC